MHMRPLPRHTSSDRATFRIRDYDGVVAALKNQDLRAARPPRALMALLRLLGQRELAGSVERGFLISLDPPDHTRLRRLVEPFFTRRRILSLMPQIEAMARNLLAQIEGQPQFDLVSAYAGPLPVHVISSIFGFAEEETDEIWRWSNAFAQSIDSSTHRKGLVARVRAFNAFRRRVLRHVSDRRAAPRDDLLTALAVAHRAGEITRRELVGLVLFVLTAGHATTTNLIGSSVYHLLNEPGLLARARSEPELIDRLVDEVVRLECPIQRTARVVAEPFDVKGHTLRPGTKLRLLIADANRDPARFSDPDRIDLAREDCRHIGFGTGPHQCLGFHLAMLEAPLAIRVLVERFPELGMTDEAPGWTVGHKLRGPTRLVVRPAPRGPD